MISVIYIIGPKFPTDCQVYCKTIFCMSRNLSTHFNYYFTSVAMWKQGLENFLNDFLTIFRRFQKLLSTLRSLYCSGMSIYSIK